jgi:hypothetical protein
VVVHCGGEVVLLSVQSLQCWVGRRSARLRDRSVWRAAIATVAAPHGHIVLPPGMCGFQRDPLPAVYAIACSCMVYVICNAGAVAAGARPDSPHVGIWARDCWVGRCSSAVEPLYVCTHVPNIPERAFLQFWDWCLPYTAAGCAHVRAANVRAAKRACCS